MSSTNSSNFKDLVNGNDSRQDISFVICTICHERYNEKCDVRAGECGHVFHYACLQQWRLESSNCPICRTDLPKQFKLYLDFEESNDSAKKQHSKGTPTNTPISVTSVSGELDLMEYENLLYEGRLYRKEIEYLTKRIAEQDELLVKNKLELANQAKRDAQMKCAFKHLQRSIMEKGTFEHLVTDFINTMSELNLDDDDNDSTSDSASGGSNGNNTYNKNKDADTLNHHHGAGRVSFLQVDDDFDLAEYIRSVVSHQQE